MLRPQTPPDSAAAAADPGTVDIDTGSIWITLDNLVDGFIALLPKLAIGLVVFIVFVFVARFVKGLIRRARGPEDNLGKVLARLAQAGLWLLGFLVAVTIVAPSVKPADLLGVLGVSGVAIGFAFKDILQNYLAGILLLLREPFKVGDEIVSGSFEGKVEAIETRATFIRTYDGRRVVIPNADVYTDAVTVKTAYDMIRSEYDVGIGYGDDIERAQQVMLEVLQNDQDVLADPAPDVRTWDLAGSSVNLRARWWTKPDRVGVVATRSRILTALKNALDAADIDMPYPTEVHLFHDQTEATDGDRTRQREGWPAGDNPPEPRTIAAAIQNTDTPAPS